jgi:tRNA(Ile2) C34 agmatinyltransferase TiaS
MPLFLFAYFLNNSMETKQIERLKPGDVVFCYNCHKKLIGGIDKIDFLNVLFGDEYAPCCVECHNKILERAK